MEEKKELINAIIKFQSEVPLISKGSEAKVKSKRTGIEYTYWFADLAAIMEVIQPYLTKNELMITHDPKVVDDSLTVTTTLAHSSGQSKQVCLTESISKNEGLMGHIQVLGKLITFIRRYNISSILNLVTEEDTDGNIPKDDNPKKDSKPQKNKKEYTYDKSGVWRYCVTEDSLNNEYQDKKGLIDTTKYKELRKAINEKLFGDIKQFMVWLKGIYKLKVWDIPNNAYVGILQTIQMNPDIIKNYIEKKEEMPFDENNSNKEQG